MTVSVFTTLGQQVATPINDIQEAGDFVQTRKLLLLE